MFPIVFAPNSQEFNSHGQGVLIDCLSCEVTEERNGIYELALTYPSSGHHADALVMDAVIKAAAHRGDTGQLFRIYEVVTNFDGTIEVQARHISYQLGFIPCSPFTATNVGEAFTKLPNYMLETDGFTFYTANTTQANFGFKQPKTTRAVLGGEEGSILDTYRGEYEFDNFTVKLHGSRGADRGVVLRYGKNITDINQEQAIDETYTGVWPFWGDPDDVYVDLPEHVVYCDNYQSFPYKRILILDCTNEFKDEYDDQTEPSVAELRAFAQRYMTEHNFGVPKVSISVSFESEGISGMDQVQLCDTVTVLFPSLQVSSKSKVIKTVYNTILGRYNSIEIGEPKSNFASTLFGTIGQSEGRTEAEIADTRNFLEKKQDEVTKTLLGLNGGFKVERTNAEGQIIETLYMDTLDEQTATKIWRWNINGLGYSPNGTSGPYTVAITKNGEIVADFITTGTLDAARVTVSNLYASAIHVSNNTTLDERLDEMQASIDNSIENYSGPDVPTLNNYPAEDWTTAAQRTSHIGDIYYVVNPNIPEDGRSYRFVQNGITFEWSPISDTDAAAALARVDELEATLESDYYDKVSIDNQFTVNNQGLLSTVSQTYSTKTQAQGYADTAQSNAISAAATDATSKANAAVTTANAATDQKLQNYSTTSQMASAISQSAAAIELSVSQTYSTKTEAQTWASNAEAGANSATDLKLENYSTTEEMNSAITQSANAITLSVSQTYSTKTEAQGYANTAQTNAINSANSATDTKLQSYSTTQQMNAAITQSANSITSSVASTYATQSNVNSLANRVTTAESKITQTESSITSLVSTTNELKAETRNLLLNTSTFDNWYLKDGSWGTVTGSAGLVNLGCTYANFPQVSASSLNWSRLLGNYADSVKLPYSAIRGRKITVSAWVYLPTGQTINGGAADFLHVELQLLPQGASSRSWYGVIGRYHKNSTPAIVAGWTRIYATITVDDNFFANQGSGGDKKSSDSVVLAFYAQTPAQIFITTPQIEYGSTCTAWAPNPEDISLSSAYSQITQNATAITSKVAKGEIISTINQSAESISIDASKINLNGVVTANNYFKINTNGSMEATNATISGSITANSGNIGGFTISRAANQGTSAQGGHFYNTSFYKHSNDGTYEYEVGLKADANDATPSSTTWTSFYTVRIPKGQTWTNANIEYMFYVLHNGTLYARNADVQGTITATAGNIGGCTISNGVLTVKNANIESINGSKVGSGISGSNVTTGTVAEARIDSKLLRTANLSSSIASLSMVTMGSSTVTNYLSVSGALVIPAYISVNNISGTLTNKYPRWYTMPAATDLATVTAIKNALAGRTFLVGT